MTHAIPDTSGKRFARLQTLGIYVPEQILLHLPKGYLDLTTVEKTVQDTHFDGLQRIYSLTVTTDAGFANKFGDKPRVSFFASDENQPIRITVFGGVYEWKNLKAGMKIFVRAKVKVWNEEIQFDSPELIHANAIGRVVAQYRGKKKVVSEETFAEYAQEALDKYLPQSAEYIRRMLDGMDEEYILQKAAIKNYRTIQDILIDVHAPKTLEHAEKGMLAARKLAAYEAVKEGAKKKQKKPVAQSAIMISDKAWQSAASNIPYQATDDQLRSIKEIVADLNSPYPMSRLLNGDVGVGKSYVIGVTAVAAHEEGARVAILTPNLLLVDQLYEEFSAWWPKKRFVKALGSTKVVDIMDNPVIIGTVALLNRLEKQKWTPDYLIVDEQERFSVKQREQLAQVHTNMLESTATCIPRTAAMISHGGMDISILTQSPVKKQIQTHLVGREDREKLFSHVHRVIESGSQVAIVYPQVSGEDERKSAIEAFNAWNRKYPGLVACLHGKMTAEEKQTITQDVKDGKYKLIVTTSILERGVTIPGLRAVVVINPERYGATQLHQLRGRLVRKGGLGYFFLYVPDQIDSVARERLMLLVNITQGHKLAEMDMEMRGFGDLSEDAESQHGASRSGIFQGVQLRPSDIAAIMSAP